MTTLRYAEDLPVAETIDLGRHLVTLEELLDFARRWDPQEFHVDAEAARAGHFGEVIASGIHTLAIFQRLCVRGALDGWAVVAGRQLREVRFLAPVTAGTELHASLRVESVTESRQGRALAVVHGEVRRDDGTAVMSVILEAYVRSRPA